MQNLREGCLNGSIYCFKIISYKGCLDINIEYMSPYKVTKIAQIKDLNKLN
jgi:hypothetical protein